MYANVSLNAKELELTRAALECWARKYREDGDAESAAALESTLAQFPHRAKSPSPSHFRAAVRVELRKSYEPRMYFVAAVDDVNSWTQTAYHNIGAPLGVAKQRALTMAAELRVPAYKVANDGTRKPLTK